MDDEEYIEKIRSIGISRGVTGQSREAADKHRTERELSAQVQRGEMSTESGDAMAGIAGLTNDRRSETPINKDL